MKDCHTGAVPNTALAVVTELFRDIRRGDPGETRLSKFIILPSSHRNAREWPPSAQENVLPTTWLCELIANARLEQSFK